MQFTASGHGNVLSEHKTTLEFTHDDYLTKRGDCILTINANFSLKSIQTQAFKKIRITIKVDNETDTLEAIYNPSFNDKHEMVIRKSNFIDQRTFATQATKAAIDIKRSIVKKLRDPTTKVTITIENINVS